MTFAWEIRARVQFEGDAHVLEDTCGFNGPNAWIIDGATTLLEPLGLPAASDPQWLAQQLSMVLGGAGESGVQELLGAALTTIDSMARTLVGEERVRFPSAAISVAQLNASGVEVASLADCTVLVKTLDGLTHLVRAGDADAGVWTGSTTPRRADFVRDRELRNTPGHLWVARREPAAAAHAHVVALGRPEIMVMATDGAWRAVELGIVNGPEEFLARCATTPDALALLHELRTRQGVIGESADDATILALAPQEF